MFNPLFVKIPDQTATAKRFIGEKEIHLIKLDLEKEVLSIRNRELTAGEKRKIKALVRGYCANYDASQRECLPLECECYMFGKHFTGAFCRYFEVAVLPLDDELAATLAGRPTKACKRCGKRFAIKGRKTYCSDICAKVAARAATAVRARKHRERNREGVTD